MPLLIAEETEAANRPTADELFDTLSKTIDQLVALGDSHPDTNIHITKFVARKLEEREHVRFTRYLNRKS